MTLESIRGGAPAGPPAPPQPSRYLFIAEGQMWSSTLGKDGEPVKKLLAKCTLTTTACYESAGKLTWEVSIDRPGKPKRSRAMDAATMERTDKMNAWFSETAGVNANLDFDDRALVKKHILEQRGAERLVIEPTHYGFIAEHGVVVGSGMAVDVNGAFVSPDVDGLFPLMCADGRLRMFKQAGDLHTQVPILSAPQPSLQRARMDLRAWAGSLHANYGRWAPAIAMGWYVANIFRPELFGLRRSFPHLFVYGRRASGKDTLVGYMNDMSGMSHVTAIAASSNPKSVRNMMNETSGWPLWVNEVRESDAFRALKELVRTSFDGQALSIARLDGGVKTFTPRRGMVLSGEDLFGGDAERLRYVAMGLARADLKPDRRTQVDSAMPNVRAAFMAIVANRKAIVPVILRRAAEFEDILMRDGVQSRQAWCWGVALAGLSVAVSVDGAPIAECLPDGIMDEVLARTRAATATLEDANRSELFWMAAKRVYDAGLMPNAGDSAWCYKTALATEEHAVYGISLRKVMNGIMLDPRFVRVLPEMESLNMIFREDPACVRWNHEIDTGTKRVRCALFNESAECIPDWVRDVAGLQQIDEE